MYQCTHACFGWVIVSIARAFDQDIYIGSSSFSSPQAAEIRTYALQSRKEFNVCPLEYQFKLKRIKKQRMQEMTAEKETRREEFHHKIMINFPGRKGKQEYWPSKPWSMAMHAWQKLAHAGCSSVKFRFRDNVTFPENPIYILHTLSSLDRRKLPPFDAGPADDVRR